MTAGSCTPRCVDTFVVPAGDSPDPTPAPRPDELYHEDATTALELLADATGQPDLTVDDLARMLRAAEDIKSRAQIVVGEVRRALLPHVQWRHPVDTDHGRLKRDWDGDKDVWNNRRTADVIVARVLGHEPSDETRRVLAAVLDLARIDGWGKTLLREQLDIEPNEEPKHPQDGVTYLGLCEKQRGRETVRFATATKPPTATPAPQEGLL